jgi:tetratricopeptide (TPR) repeat protein
MHTPGRTCVSSPSVNDFQIEIGARMARGDWAAAAAAAAGCRAAWPANSAGWLLGSIAALFADKKEWALALVEERLAIDPKDLQCALQKAECLLALGRRAEALQSAEFAFSLAGDDSAALDALGTFFVYSAEHARALEIYDRAVRIAPKNAALFAKRAEVHRFLGNFELAALDYQAVLALAPRDAEALKGLAGLREQSADRNSVAAMEAALAAAPAGAEDISVLHFGLAKSYEDMGEYAASWRHLSAANRLQRARYPYDPAHERAVVERIIAGFPSVEPLSSDTTGERPIFIVGLPRTGTTLVERILGSHSQIHSAGELQALSEAIRAAVAVQASDLLGTWLDYAGALGRLDGALIAREYLTRVRAQRGDRPRFSDKQPANFFYCALILRAFPNARIVHLTRHPLAACYAIYKTRFWGAFPFGNDLNDLGDFYVDYRRLMAHWHTVLPGRILDVAYEDVVHAIEPSTRRLLEFVGVPFEAACLEFHRNPTAAMTASSVQVRQPLYDSSLHQWQNYAMELAPLRKRLETAGIPIESMPRSEAYCGVKPTAS